MLSRPASDADDSDVSDSSEELVIEFSDSEVQTAGEGSEGKDGSDMAGITDDVDDGIQSDDEEELPEVSDIFPAVAVRRGPYNYRNICRRKVQELMQH
jgi:hypothetical protein